VACHHNVTGSTTIERRSYLQESQLNRDPATEHIERTDTTGLDQIFSSQASDDMSDRRQGKRLEMPISEAATVLGISERTLWRRIENGELKSRLKGNKRLVRVPVADVQMHHDSATASGDTTKFRQVGTVVDLAAIMHELSSANYRVGYLQGQLEIKDQQLRLLPDLQSKAEEASELKTRLALYEAEIVYLKRPWWKRLLGLE
jgi:excisionase family DNA binding protein